MFKLLIGLIILGLILVVVYVGKKLADSYIKDKENSSNKRTSIDDIDIIIQDLELKIELCELRASKGIISAENDLKRYQADLEKAKKIKNKFKNN